MTRTRTSPALTSQPILVGLALCLAVLPARGRAAPSGARAEAFQAFQAGGAGDARAAARAAAAYHELSAADPDDPVLLSYAGASQAMLGRDASSPLDAMNLTEAGLALVDQAVQRVGPAHDRPGPSGMPMRLETWLVAATTYLAVPDAVFHRLNDGKAVLALAEAHPAFGRLPPGVRAHFALLDAQVARAEQRPEDELAALKHAVALDPRSPQVLAAQARAAELSR